MSEIQEESQSHLHTLSFLGPASVIFSVLLLVINDSPFYIDFSACAMVGLVLCWRFKLKGFVLSSSILGSLLFYEHFYHPDPVTLWDVGLVLSVLLAFLVTALSSMEFVEMMRSFGGLAASEIQSWEAKVEESLSGNKRLERVIQDLEEQVKCHSAEVKAKKESSDFFERLLQITRNELVQQTALREKVEQESLLRKSEHQEKIQDLTIELEKLTSRLRGLESEKGDIEKALIETDKIEKTLTHALFEQEEKVKTLSSEKEDQEGKIKHLTGELEKLTDRLKGLESEKGEIEKALGEALTLKSNALSDKDEKIHHLTGELEKLTDRLKGLESEKGEIEKALGEALTLKSNALSDKEEKIHHLTGELEKLTGRLKGLESEKGEIEKALGEALILKSNALSDQEEKIKHLTDELEKLTGRLKGLESEKEDIAKALGEALGPKEEAKSSKDFAKMQGLYQQLRTQFEEKSRVLDQTRAELFGAKEALSQLEIDSKETDLGHHDLWGEHVKELSDQISSLELEVTLLEELVFKGHHPL